MVPETAPGAGTREGSEKKERPSGDGSQERRQRPLLARAMHVQCRVQYATDQRGAYPNY